VGTDGEDASILAVRRRCGDGACPEPNESWRKCSERSAPVSLVHLTAGDLAAEPVDEETAGTERGVPGAAIA
jgi:hypothetical protein